MNMQDGRSPELLAPAGDWDCAKAAVENGADAVYFGLQNGLNARARAANFAQADIGRLMTFLRVRGVKGYLTLNTLVFRDEMDEARRAVQLAIEAGVDALLVQDLGLLRLAHDLCPELPLHASTQMTLACAECIEEVVSLGVRRVVLSRELSIEQIAAIRRQTGVELETFVHGALCISYSGQCLASLSLGGRSANRGRCAQPCRLSYEVIASGGSPSIDGDRAAKNVAISDVPPVCPKYPISPHDLAAFDRMAQLTAAGVAALKIEGRLKPPEYVAAVTRHYREAIDAQKAEGHRSATTASPEDEKAAAELELIFSRGFCRGWLDGDDHASLVSGASSAKCGILLGEVRSVRGERVTAQLVSPVRCGDGVVFEGDRESDTELGGRIYEIFAGRRSVKEAAAGDVVELAFQRGAVSSESVRPGQKLRKTDDPQLLRRIRKTYEAAAPRRRVSVDVAVEAAAGKPLKISAATASGIACRIESSEPAAEALKHPLTVETLVEQLGRLGGTPYRLRNLDAKIDGHPMVPLSVLGSLRHEMVRRLEAAAAVPPAWAVASGSSGHDLSNRSGSLVGASSTQNTPGQPRRRPWDDSDGPQGDAPRLHVLCRTLEQLDAALAEGASSVVADLREDAEHGEAVQMARAARATVLLATPRIHRPDDRGVFERLISFAPDGLLARNLAATAFCRREGVLAVADFSLNVVNDWTAAWLCKVQRVCRVTAAYDLDRRRLLDLAASLPPGTLEVVVHRHTPMFHSQYCLFCKIFSRGKNRADCGRPCRRYGLRLRDRRGEKHVVWTDGRCRNTIFRAKPESFSDGDFMASLLGRGVWDFRVELSPDDDRNATRRAVAFYKKGVFQAGAIRHPAPWAEPPS